MSTQPASRKGVLHAFVIAILTAVMGTVFVVAYSVAMGDPMPRNVPIGVVGTADQTAQAASVLDPDGADSFAIATFPDADAAMNDLDRQRVYSVLDLSATPATLTLSTASSASVARLVQAQEPQLQEQFGADLTITDSRPLAPRDPSGLVLFYLALGATILGFVGAIQTRVYAPGLSIPAALGWDLARSVFASFLMTLVIGPVLGLENFPFIPVLLVLTVTMFAAAMVYNFWLAAIGGTWALLPTWIIFVIIANPSSGGAVAPELLPPFFEVIGRWLPTGAAVSALRDVTYFPDSLSAEPFLVLIAWSVIPAVAYAVISRIRADAAASAPGSFAAQAGAAGATA